MIPILTALAGGAGKGLIEAVGDIADNLITTDEERAVARLDQFKAETDRLAVQQEGLKGQLDINKAEARHHSIFVAGWRPAAGWVCVSGLAYSVMYYLILWVFVLAFPAHDPPPNIDTGVLVTLLSGMLGIGGFRTYEKFKGVARDGIPKGGK